MERILNRKFGSASKILMAAGVLGTPIPISLLRAYLQIGFAGRIPLQLHPQPLKPLKGFLGTAPAAFLLDHFQDQDGEIGMISTTENAECAERNN